jgi:hypothetical protein
MRKYVKNHGIIFGGPQNFVGFSTGPWTGKGWETLLYCIIRSMTPMVTAPEDNGNFFILKPLLDEVVENLVMCRQ